MIHEGATYGRGFKYGESHNEGENSEKFCTSPTVTLRELGSWL